MKNMKKILVVVLLLAALAAGGLWFYFFEKEPLMSLKYPDEAEAVITRQTAEDTGSEQTENTAAAEIFQTETFTAKPNAATAHEKHLNDSLKFEAFPQNIEINKSTAVVASDSCQFFQIESINSPEDLKLLKDGIKIPAGTILTLTGGAFRNVNAAAEDNGTFSFEKIKNWFYPVEYAGKSGIVFAGDLRGIDAPAEANEILSMRYSASSPNSAENAELTGGWQTAGDLKNYQKFNQFYPFCGTAPLDGELQKLLQKDKAAIKQISSIEYANILSAAQSPVLEPMLELYLSHYNLETKKTESALFFTTDLFARYEELLYQKVLLNLQEKSFLPKMMLLCDAFIEQLSGETENIADKAESITETGHDTITIIVPDEITQKALLYFQTGRALGECMNAESASLLFNRKTSDGTVRRATADEVEASLDVILENYPDAVKKEVLNILRAQYTEASPVFTFADGTSYRLDYSAFAVPEKYSTSSALAAFYRINTWFSSIKFPVAEENLLNTQNEISSLGDEHDEQKLAFKMAPVALYISNMVLNSQPLMEKWQLLYSAQNALCGSGLNLSFEEIAQVYSAKSEQSAKIWLSKPANIAEFALNASRKCTSPALGNLQNDFKLYAPEQVEGQAENAENDADVSYLFAASFANTVYPCWSLFADNYELEQWFYKTLAQILPASERQPVLREKVELLASLDSSFGAEIAANKKEIEVLKKCFAAQKDDFWNKNYHALTLKQTKALANFEPGSKFYFTESSVWGKKALQSAAVFSTQSQHLQPESFYSPKVAEKAESFSGEFRTKNLPKMVSYLEPNVEFFTAARQATAYLRAVLGAEDFSFGGNQKELLNAVGNFESLLETAQRIAKTEVQNQPLDEKDLNWIESIPFELAEILKIYQKDGEVVQSAETIPYFAPALCRQLVQNAAAGETDRLSALGVPGRLYVALNDEQGGKRIACGYAFSYYEFDENSRAGDFAANWQNTVQSGGNLENYKPEWLK